MIISYLWRFLIDNFGRRNCILENLKFFLYGFFFICIILNLLRGKFGFAPYILFIRGGGGFVFSESVWSKDGEFLHRGFIISIYDISFGCGDFWT